MADVYLYPNTLQAVAITGAQVKDWLERSAGIFLQVEPGKADQPLIDPAFPAYNFDVIDGVTYAIDVTQPSRYDAEGELVNPEASRIVDLRLERRAARPRGEGRGRDQQLPRRRRRQLPRRGRLDGDPGGARHQPRRDRALHRRAGHDLAGLGRQLAARAGRGRDGDSSTPGRGPTRTSPTCRARGLAIEPAGDAPDGFVRYRITL